MADSHQLLAIIFIEFINIGPAYTRMLVGGVWEWGRWWQRLKQRSKMIQIVEFRVAIYDVHIGPIFHYTAYTDMH